jgi:hypothetical protein
MDIITFAIIWLATGVLLASIITIQAWWTGEDITLNHLGNMVLIVISGVVAWIVVAVFILCDIVAEWIDGDHVIIPGRQRRD